jgi:hypothetical protein
MKKRAEIRAAWARKQQVIRVLSVVPGIRLRHPNRSEVRK